MYPAPPSIPKSFLLSSKALALLSGLGTTLLGAVVLAFGGAGAPLQTASTFLMFAAAAAAPWLYPYKRAA